VTINSRIVGKPQVTAGSDLLELLPHSSSSVQNNGNGQLVTNMELGMARWNS
jgi:hypothetical protein